jgi:hypothetical protein
MNSKENAKDNGSRQIKKSTNKQLPPTELSEQSGLLN